MAREEKRIELRPVDGMAQAKTPAIRLGKKRSIPSEQPVRLKLPPGQVKVVQVVDSPDSDASADSDNRGHRAHEPGIEALIETETIDPDLLEKQWGRNRALSKKGPWGWLVLIVVVFVGALAWSLIRAGKGESDLKQIKSATVSALKTEAEEDLQATRLIEHIESTIRRYCNTTNIDTLAQVVRQPERVHPLMVQYYAQKPRASDPLLRISLIQPLTLDMRANFWVATIELTSHEIQNFIIEILDSGEARIDWETLVCNQPMPWDTFAKERPSGRSLDFRVYAESDTFFSHEFNDGNQWNCFRLTALDSEETLYGYAKIDSEVSQQIREELKKNQGNRTSLILRLSIPPGLESKRGVVIEKLVCPRWIYLDPPDTGS